MMVKLLNNLQLNFYLTHACRDLLRSYKNILSIIITLFLSLFILSTIFTVKDNLEKSLSDNAKVLLGGDLELDYKKSEGNKDLLNKIKKFSYISEIIEFNTMISSFKNNDIKLHGISGSYIDSGAKHFVLINNIVDKNLLYKLAQAIRYDDYFQPDGLNVNFLNIISKYWIKINGECE